MIEKNGFDAKECKLSEALVIQSCKRADLGKTPTEESLLVLPRGYGDTGFSTLSSTHQCGGREPPQGEGPSGLRELQQGRKPQWLSSSLRRRQGIVPEGRTTDSTGRVTPRYMWDVLPVRGSGDCSWEDPLPDFALEREKLTSGDFEYR